MRSLLRISLEGHKQLSALQRRVAPDSSTQNGNERLSTQPPGILIESCSRIRRTLYQATGRTLSPES